MAVLAFHRKWFLIATATVVVAAMLVSTVYLLWRPPDEQFVEERGEPEAPPDLANLRDRFIAGAEAVLRKDGREAVQQLASFHFGSRNVEEYRLYYLAGGYELTGNRKAARATLDKLWRRKPRLIHAEEALFNLAGMHVRAGAWSDAAAVYQGIARHTENSAIAGTARWREIETSLAVGDISAARTAAVAMTVHSPNAPETVKAIELVRSLDELKEDEALPLAHEQRFERAVNLMRDGEPRLALAELTALEPSAPESLRPPIQLHRGLALHRMRRYDESTRVLERLTATYYKYAIPALYHLALNYRTVSASIDPTVTKTITERKQVGTVKVRVGKGKKRRTVTRPKFANVKRTIKLIDLARKKKKEEYARLSSERLKDMLLLPLSEPLRLEVLNTLIGAAVSKNQDAYAQELVQQAVKLDPLGDPALQHFWNKAWTSYTKGDLGTARKLLRFIADTYRNPNVKRQAEYWFGRTIERQGGKEEAAAIYRRLASAPYADLYALHAESRGAPRQTRRDNPLRENRPDWPEIAEKQMPTELRLAYELTALTAFRDARLEIQKNIRPENHRYAEALLADLYNSTGNELLMYKSIRRAWPQLATVEQDSVPPYFLRMYYPVKYEDAVRKYAARNGLDPYLVMGLILQESYYNPKARSMVGATGLMQIMPPTGKEIAGRLRIPFGAARLENPEVNIQLGTHHLRRLIDMFGGNAYLAIASYNAGQGNVLRWRRTPRGKPLDEFLESIPFPETRNYVKRVTLLRSSYERLAS
jgi:soluble lytic murein transglycosylase-like protein/tetratricopeptide (TPR) repeat protein